MGHVHLRKRVNCSVAFAQGNVGKTKHHSALSLDSKMINNGAAVASSRRCGPLPPPWSLWQWGRSIVLPSAQMGRCSVFGSCWSEFRIGAAALTKIKYDSHTWALQRVKGWEMPMTCQQLYTSSLRCFENSGSNLPQIKIISRPRCQNRASHRHLRWRPSLYLDQRLLVPLWEPTSQE